MSLQVVGVWSGSTEPTVGIAPGQIWLDLSIPAVPIFKVLTSINPSVWRNISLTYRGEWDPAARYFMQDVVDWGNSTYVCIVFNTGMQPNLNPDKWVIAAWKGYNSSSSTSSIDGVGVPNLPDFAQVGTVTLYAQFGFPAPPGWVYCDGTLYGTTQFPALYAKIDRAYTKNTDPQNSFRVPEIKPLNTAVGQAISYVIKT